MSDAADVLRMLEEHASTVAVAESLTGGLLGARITAVPGSSRAFRGGVIAYATDAKSSLLGVSPDLLAARGAVHPDVALAMACGARERLVATYGVGLTGVAGPDGQDGETPGTVFVAVCGPTGARVERLAVAGGREQVREAAVAAALGLLAEVVATSVG